MQPSRHVWKNPASIAPLSRCRNRSRTNLLRAPNTSLLPKYSVSAAEPFPCHHRMPSPNGYSFTSSASIAFFAGETLPQKQHVVGRFMVFQENWFISLDFLNPTHCNYIMFSAVCRKASNRSNCRRNSLRLCLNRNCSSVSSCAVFLITAPSMGQSARQCGPCGSSTHSVQSPVRIQNRPSRSRTASLGHSGRHTPHPMHSSVMQKDID